MIIWIFDGVLAACEPPAQIHINQMFSTYFITNNIINRKAKKKEKKYKQLNYNK